MGRAGVKKATAVGFGLKADYELHKTRYQETNISEKPEEPQV
jgi:hypothetical protein